jgi:hypothetical protein
VRRTIHSSVTPILGAISAFCTMVWGRLTPTDPIAAPALSGSRRGSRERGTVVGVMTVTA